ncbi:hypothetical protein PspLS_11858 [Pyricularia sp. CBS 133598]|nr:hypothetical protein PspLS_11858 [Pyricularia sp. CBS 133598]
MDGLAEKALRNSLKRLRISGEYSDMTMICGDDTYHVHKPIMCPRSKYFEVSLKADMQERDRTVTKFGADPLSRRATHPTLSSLSTSFIWGIINLHSKSQPGDSRSRKKHTNFDIPAAALPEPEPVPPLPEPAVNETEDWFSFKREGKEKKKKGKLVDWEEPAGPSKVCPDPKPINIADSMLDKTFLLTHSGVYTLAEYLQVCRDYFKVALVDWI